MRQTLYLLATFSLKVKYIILRLPSNSTIRELPSITEVCGIVILCVNFVQNLNFERLIKKKV